MNKEQAAKRAHEIAGGMLQRWLDMTGGADEPTADSPDDADKIERAVCELVDEHFRKSGAKP